MKRIVVTGAKGGTGQSIVHVLRDAGYDVVGVDIKPPQPGDGDYICVDLRDAASVNDAFTGIDGVIHFGSPPGDVGMTSSEAFGHLTTAGFNVFQAARNCQVKRVVWASSIEVYGPMTNHLTLPVTEKSPLAPPSIYGASKVLLESLARDYSRWYGMSIAGFRLSRIIYDNPFGRAKLKRFVDDQALGHDSLWSYIDARDVATACLAWLTSDQQGAEVFNVAANNVHLDVPIRSLMQQHGYSHAKLTDELGEYQTAFSSEKLQTMLNWQAQYNWKQLLQVDR